MFKEIVPHQFSMNPFKLLSRDWMLITAGNKDKVNTMTASWGGFGEMWGKHVAFIVVRPQRYTKEFLDREDAFSLSFFDDEYKEALSYLGTVSGRTEDKIKKAKMSVNYSSDVPFIDESRVVFFCKNLYKEAINPESFILDSIKDSWYSNEDYHVLYIAEITRVLKKTNK
ncbi:MAG TPA: flavin reductase family protein [Clostridiales bacterium]|nr:flavin reductase family protein [Clostridiales bacterium]